jgi:hypothetical protein
VDEKQKKHFPVVFFLSINAAIVAPSIVVNVVEQNVLPVALQKVRKLEKFMQNRFT